MVKITSSVGRNGINKSFDVKKIQSLLNKNLHLLPSVQKLSEDGMVGKFTISAILSYQKNVVKMPRPDGRVDPNGKTIKSLNKTVRGSRTASVNGDEKIAIIIYGDGKELGDFKIFANNVKRDLSGKYSKIILEYVNRDTKFINLLTGSVGTNEKIGELHIFSHSIGAGLFLGYKDPIISSQRNLAVANAQRAGGKVSYSQAVSIEAGAIQTDDLYRPLFINKKSILRGLFATDAFVKIWGCNSGVSNWKYTDSGVSDPLDTSVAYYWRAFNERHPHKLSISQALSNFLNVKVFGANSGASIQVRHSGAWISSKKYNNTVGHWPSGRLPHRLVPDRGDYNEFTPR